MERNPVEKLSDGQNSHVLGILWVSCAPNSTSIFLLKQNFTVKGIGKALFKVKKQVSGWKKVLWGTDSYPAPTHASQPGRLVAFLH